jgi:hypothetical protein
MSAVEREPFHGSHRLDSDMVMIKPPGIDNGAFVVSPDTVWYARVLLLFFERALVWTLENIQQS